MPDPAIERGAEAALIVFAKHPAPGRVKTRLTALLTPEEAAALYEAFVRDALDAYAGLGADVHVFVAPVGEAAPEADVFERAAALHEQMGEGLGTRMQHAFAKTFAQGYRRVVIIGTDHPTLPRAYVEKAYEELKRPRTIVIGPSEDGGYYLLGMNDFFPDVFENMRYSRPDVFDETVNRAASTTAGLVILPEWYDVDEPETLVRLIHDLPETEAACTRTRRVVEGIRRRYPEALRTV